jgi:hypothetical protein
VCPGDVFITFGGPQGHADRLANLPALWGSQSWLQPAFSRLSSPRGDSLVSAARDAPEETAPARVNATCVRDVCAMAANFLLTDLTMSLHKISLIDARGSVTIRKHT